MRKIILFLTLLLPLLGYSAIPLKPHDTYICVVNSVRAENESWSKSGNGAAYLSLNVQGQKCEVTATDYFSGVATVTCTYRTFETSIPYTETWEFTCKRDDGGGSSSDQVTVSLQESSPLTLTVGDKHTFTAHPSSSSYSGSYKWYMSGNITDSYHKLSPVNSNAQSVYLYADYAGEADVTVMLDNGKYDTVHVIVGDTSNPENPPISGDDSKISLKYTNEIITIGKQLYISASKPNVEAKKIIWWSTDKSVADVECAIGFYNTINAYKEGTCVIKAGYSQEEVAECKITVMPPAESIEVTPQDTTLYVGDQINFHVDVYPPNAYKNFIISNNNFTKISDSDFVFTAKNAGKVRQIVFAFDSGSNPKTVCMADLNFEIKEKSLAVSKITLDKSELSLEEGECQTLTAIVLPSDATNQKLSWISSNNSVATVKDGVVTALSEGTATITCTAKDGSGVSASCEVTVRASVKDGDIAEVNSLLYRLYPSDNTAVVAKQETKLEGDVTIPEKIEYKGVSYTVTKIGEFAFSGQNKITSVNLPSTIKIIHSYAFMDIDEVKSIEIPDNVEKLGDYIFAGSRSLESIYIGRGVSLISDYAFSICYNLKNIIVSDDNNYFQSKGGILYSKDLTTVYKVPDAMQNIEWVSNVRILETGSFSFNSALEDINLPYELEEIGVYAFTSCEKLKEIDVPDSVTKILYGAFNGCKSLSTIKIGENVKIIEGGAFATGSNYSHIYVRALNPPVTDKIISNKTIFDNYNATLYVPIGSRSAYANADNWKNFSSIIEIDFDGAESITLSKESVELVEGDTYKLEYTITPADCKSNVIWTSSDTSVATVKDGVITAVGPGTATITCTSDDGNKVTASCQVTVTALVKDGEKVEVNSLRYRLYPSENRAVVAYQENDLSGAISIPERIAYKDVSYTVTEIGDSAFWFQDKITGVIIPTTVKKIGNYAFYEAELLTSIVIPDNVESIGKEPFDFCYSLESIYIGSGLKSMGSYPLWGCPKLSDIRVSDNNQYFTSDGEILYSKDFRVVYKVVETLSNLSLHKNVQTISNGCFSSNNLIKHVDLPEGLLLIGVCSFAYCENLQSIDIPDNVTEIWGWAFEDCKSLNSIKIGKSVVEIDQEAFATGSNYSEVYIRAINPPAIESNTFDNYAATLYVPIGSRNAYANSDNWKNFSQIVEIDFDGAESITLSKESVELVEGDTYKLEYTITPADCKSNMIWTSSDTSVATVKDGVITAVGPGTATITCTSDDGNKVTASCQVTVANEIVLVESISVVPETLEIKFTGATTFLDVYINPSNATDKSISYESSDNSIVRVSEHKKDPLTSLLSSPKPVDNIPITYDITAVSPGTATITFKAKDSSGVSASCVVTVKGNAGVDSVSGGNGVTVATGNGFMKLCSGRAVAVAIFNMNGVLVEKVALNADEAREIPLVPGVYIVNGAKYIVD